MRVIAGELRGKKLQAPKDDHIRPTTDRVKESLFNLIAGDIHEDTVVFDLFAGSGSLGIEALSRGAKRAYFCDNNRNSYELLKTNLSECRLVDHSVVFFGEYQRGLEQFAQQADIIFVDPPYGMNLWESCMKQIMLLDKLKPQGIVVLESSTKDLIMEIPEQLQLVKERHYGKITIWIYRRTED